MGKFKIVGLTIGLTWLAFLALAVFIKGISVLFNPFFESNALMVTIISGIIVLLLIVTGSITIGAMMSKGKGIFG